MLRTVYLTLNKIRAFAIVVVFAWIIGLCLVQITLRYFTPDDLTPFAWGDEVIRLCGVWIIFLAASLGVREGSHLSVEYFIEKLLPGKWLRLAKRLAMLLVLAVLAALIWYGAVQTRLNVPSMLENLSISRAWFYAAIPVGCAFLFLDYCLILIFGSHPFAKWKLSAAGTESTATERGE